MLKFLEESEYRWIYELLVIFNKGDIEIYDKVIDNAVTRNVIIILNLESIEIKESCPGSKD